MRTRLLLEQQIETVQKEINGKLCYIVTLLLENIVWWGPKL